MEQDSFLRSSYKKNLLLFGTLSILIVQIVFMYRFYVDRYIFALCVLLVLFPLAILSLFLISKHERLFSSYLSATSGLGCVVLLCWIFGGFKAPAPQWVAFSPLIFGLFFGKKSMPVSIVFMILTYTLFYFVESPMSLSPEKYQEEKVLNVFLQSFIMPVIVYAFVGSMNEYQDDLKSQNSKNKKLLRVLLHDISNPLTVIKLISRRIKNEIDPKHSKKLEANTEIIANILEEVKAHNAQDSKDKLFEEVFCAHKVLENVNNLFEEFAQRKGVELQVNNLLDEDVKLQSNLGLLQSQVIYNLVSNAIKFTPEEGSVSVTANTVNNNVIFEIKDDGEGIDLDKVLFLDDDSKTHSSIGTDGEVGNGYGLGLVNYFLKKLEGELSIFTNDTEASIEKGTLFRISLPIHLS